MPVLRVVGGLFGLLGWVVFAGLQRAWKRTFGWLFNTLADLLDIGIPIPHFRDPHPFARVADWLRSLDRNVSALLGYLTLESEQLAVWLFSRFHLVWTWLGREIEGLAADLLGLALRVIKVTIPHFVRQLGREIVQGWAKIWRYIRSQLPAIWRLLKRYGRSIARQAGVELHRWIHGLRAFAWLEGKLLGYIRSASRRLIALERHFVPKGLRKWLAALFPIFGIAWLLGQSWRRLGEAVLRWSYRMVRGFIAWFGHLDDQISMKEVVHESQKLVPVALAAMDFWISEFHAQKLAPGPVEPPQET